MARLAQELSDAGDDCRECTRRAAVLIADELGDVATVLVLDPPGHDGAAIGIAHRDPSLQAMVEGLVAEATPADLRAFAEAVAHGGDPVITDLALDAGPPLFASAFGRYQEVAGPTSVAFAPLRDLNKVAVGFIATVRDGASPPYTDADLSAVAAAADKISSLLLAMNARASESALHRQWSTAFSAAPIGMAVLTPAGSFVAVNASACVILGRDATELVGGSWDGLVSSADADDDEPDFPGRPGYGAIGGYRVRRIVRPDGSFRWIRLTMAVVPDQRGEPDAVHAQFIDVTEQHDAEERAGRFVSLVHSSPDFIAVADLDGHVVFLNEAGRWLVGMPMDVDVEHTTIADYLSPAGVKASEEVERPAILREGSWQGWSTLRDWRDDSEIAVSVTSYLMRDRLTGAPAAFATVQRDIRDRLVTRQAITDLAEQRRLLLTELVSAERAEQHRIATEVHDDSVQILAAGQLRMQLVTRLLDDGDLDGAQKSLRAATELVSTALQRLRRILVTLEPAGGPDTDLDVAFHEAAHQFFDGTPTVVRIAGALSGLPTDIAAVFHRAGREALSNARRHAHATTVDVTLLDEPDAWILVVEDDGVGVPDEIVGLAGHLGIRGMVSRVEALGGECTITRRPSNGTRVHIAIPRAGD